MYKCEAGHLQHVEMTIIYEVIFATSKGAHGLLVYLHAKEAKKEKFCTFWGIPQTMVNIKIHIIKRLSDERYLENNISFSLNLNRIL